MTTTVLALSGSLRTESLNTRLAHAAADLAPEGMRLEPATLHGIPLYDGDVEAEGIPAPVTALAERVAELRAEVRASSEADTGEDAGASPADTEASNQSE